MLPADTAGVACSTRGAPPSRCGAWPLQPPRTVVVASPLQRLSARTALDQLRACEPVRLPCPPPFLARSPPTSLAHPCRPSDRRRPDRYDPNDDYAPSFGPRADWPSGQRDGRGPLGCPRGGCEHPSVSQWPRVAAAPDDPLRQDPLATAFVWGIERPPGEATGMLSGIRLLGVSGAHGPGGSRRVSDAIGPSTYSRADRIRGRI